MSTDSHFSLEGSGEPSATGRFVDVSKVAPLEGTPVVPGPPSACV